MLQRRSFWLVSLCPLVLSWTASAWAQAGDTVTLSAAYTQQTDSNLFRLPDSANVNALIGRPDASENISITSLGININKAYSLQRFELSLNLVDTKYQSFSYLDYVARNYDAAWRWSITPHLHGSLSTSRNETLNSFADYQNVNQRNKRTNTQSGFDVAYDVTGAWQLLAGLARSRQSNQQEIQAESDYRSNSANVGLRYAYASGSALTYILKTTDGANLNQASLAPGSSGDSFDQTDHTLKLLWVVSGKSAADLTLGHINRQHPQFAQRDYSGMTAAVNFNWSMSGKTALTASWARELSSYQTNYASYAQKDRFSVGPTWQVSPKVAIRLRHTVTQINYLSAPASVTLPAREDTTQDASLSVDWQPYKRLNLYASLQKATRESNFAGLDFDSNIANFSAQYSF